MPVNVRLCFGQPCSPTRNGRFARPCDHSAYTYTPSGRSPARLVSFSQVPPGSALRNCGFVPKPCFCGLSARLSASPLKTLRVFRRLRGPKQSRAWHPRTLGKQRIRSSLASGKSSTPPARCIHRPQRDTSSAGYRLLVSLASVISPERSEPRKRSLEVCASRELSSRRSPALAPHTYAVSPTFRCGAFSFVVFALAAFLSARLTAYGNNAQTCILQQFRGVCPRLLCRRHGNVVWLTDGRTRMTGERTPSGYIDSYDNDKRYQKANHSRPQVLRPRHPPCNPFNRTKHRNEEK